MARSGDYKSPSGLQRRMVFIEKSFALPKFLLTCAYIRPKVLEDLFSLTLIEDGNKKRMFCAKITNAQIKFLKSKYEVELKKSWLYQV